MAEVLSVGRVDRVLSRSGRSFLKVTTPAGVFYAEPALAGKLRPGAVVEAEWTEELGVKVIKEVRTPDGAPAAAGAAAGAEGASAGAEGPGGASCSGSAAGTAAGADPALKALALEAALKLLAARAGAGTEELLATAERVLAWLKA